MRNARRSDPLQVTLRNPGGSDLPYHAWAEHHCELSGAVADRLTLNDMACGKSTLAVGACGNLKPKPNPAQGETITDYSGAGPTLDGLIKLEIVAVGGGGFLADWVCSASSDLKHGYHGENGTSMAAPLTAGAIALLYEAHRKRGLDIDAVKALLTQNAHRQGLKQDPNRRGYVAAHRNRYGYGRLRAKTAVGQLLPPADVDVWVRTADDDYGVEPYVGGPFWIALDLAVFESGTTTRTDRLRWGRDYDVEITVRNLGNAVATDTRVSLKYTLPGATPKDWKPTRGTHSPNPRSRRSRYPPSASSR